MGLAAPGGLPRGRPDLFFLPDRERGAARQERVARAKAVCRACPVVGPCLAHAVAVPEDDVRGGRTEEERAVLRRRSAPRGTAV